MPGGPDILLIADQGRDDVSDVVAELEPIFAEHAGTVVRCDISEDPVDAAAQADLAVVVGGDGTMIQQSRRLLSTDLPIVPINCGHLGFLASFDAASLAREAAEVFGDAPLRRRHMVLSIDLHRANGEDVLGLPAMNDCVITAGPPFRMIRLALDIEGQGGPTMSGDGLIVSTPTGSTAYNVSAGGPIVAPGVDALIVTPLAAHSLGFRSFVVPGDGALVVHVEQANPGTTIVLDGQEQLDVEPGDTVRLTRHERSVDMITCSAEPYWRILIDKMRWAVPPTYRDGAV